MVVCGWVSGGAVGVGGLTMSVESPTRPTANSEARSATATTPAATPGLAPLSLMLTSPQSGKPANKDPTLLLEGGSVAGRKSLDRLVERSPKMIAPAAAATMCAWLCVGSCSDGVLTLAPRLAPRARLRHSDGISVPSCIGAGGLLRPNSLGVVRIAGALWANRQGVWADRGCGRCQAAPSDFEHEAISTSCGVWSRHGASADWTAEAP